MRGWGTTMLTAALLGCGPGQAVVNGPPSLPLEPAEPTVEAAGEIQLSLDLTAFTGDASDKPLFSLVVGDGDGDGDLDVLFNRHHLAPLELYLGDTGHFELTNPLGADPTGLFENAGVPDLYGDEAALLAAAMDGPPGVSLWHDIDRTGVWHLVTLPEGDRPTPPLRLTANRPVLELSGVEPAEVAQLDPFTVEVSLTDPDVPRHFTFANNLVGTQLILEVLDDASLPVFVGSQRVPQTAGELSVWKPDPHGLAWHDVVAGPEPELFVTRGGLTGLLLPPHDPKTDQLFVGVGPATWEQDVAAIPPSYGRGRQVAWVDVDGDGSDELFLGNTETANTVLDDEGTGVFVDRAEELGLDHHHGDAFAWLDVDDDGWIDLIYTEQTELRVARSLAGAAFVDEAGAAWGLISPAAPSDAPEGLFDPFTFMTADLDRDGELDLVLSGWGKGDALAVFRNEPGGFSNATAAMGLDAPVAGTLVLTDVDVDGWIDAVMLSDGVAITRNDHGTFVTEAPPEGWPTPDVPWIGVAADLDGDRLEELVGAAGEERFVVWNETVPAALPVVVRPEAPLGTTVVSIDAAGRRTAAQWGGSHSSRYSQSVLPLVFGVGEGPRIIAVEWTPPGGEATTVRLRPGQTEVWIGAGR